MSGSWVVVQNAEEVERALALEEPESGSLSYLAVSAAAYFGFMERGLPCRGTHEFATRESTNEVATKNFDELHSLVLLLDDATHEQDPGMPLGFKPFEAYEYDLNKLIDSASFALMELLGFVQEESPSEILYWDNSQEHGHAKGQTLTSELLDQQEWWAGQGVETRRISGRGGVPVAGGARGWRSKLRRLLNPNRTDSIRLLGWAPSPALLRGSRPRLLVVGKSDNLVSFAKHAIANNRARLDWWTHNLHAPVHMPTLGRVKLNGASKVASDFLRVLKGVIDRSGAHASWGHEQHRLPVGTIVQRRLLEFRKRVPRLWEAFGKSMDYFHSRRPAAVICGTADPDLVQVIRQAARASGVPMASFQHGGAFGYMHSDWIALSDLRADLYVAYGVDGSKYLEGLAKSRGLPAKACGIGWSRGAALARALNEPSQSKEPQRPSKSRAGSEGRRVITYVPTGLGGERRHGPDHGYHDTEYCLEQVRVIEALMKVPDAIVNVKLHPKDSTSNPLGRWVERLGDDRVHALVGGRLPDVLKRTDVVVLDCPTTTLLEVMATASRLVYLHLGIMKWTPEGETLMRTSAPWVDVTPGWETSLGEVVVQALGEPAPLPRDNQFLDAYASLDFQPELVWDRLRDLQGARARGSV